MYFFALGSELSGGKSYNQCTGVNHLSMRRAVVNYFSGLRRMATLFMAIAGLMVLTSCGGDDEPDPAASGDGGGTATAASSSPEPPAKPSREEVKQMGKDRLTKLIGERPFDRDAKIKSVMQEKLQVDITALPETRPTVEAMRATLLEQAKANSGFTKEDEKKIEDQARATYRWLKPGEYQHMHHNRKNDRTYCGYVSPSKNPGNAKVRTNIGQPAEIEIQLKDYGYQPFAFDPQKIKLAQKKYIYDNFTKAQSAAVKKYITENQYSFYKSQGWIKGKDKMMTVEQYIKTYIEPKLAAEEKAHVD
jgi:hypothetical protein